MKEYYKSNYKKTNLNLIRTKQLKNMQIKQVTFIKKT